MKTCKFNSDECSVDCPKFTICMYNSIQHQLSEINSQINSILSILPILNDKIIENKENIDNVATNITTIVETLVDITNDSEQKQLQNKESDI